MIVIDRAARRTGYGEWARVFRDIGERETDECQAELLFCPLSGDVEVDYDGKCVFKAWIHGAGPSCKLWQGEDWPEGKCLDNWDGVSAGCVIGRTVTPKRPWDKSAWAELVTGSRDWNKARTVVEVMRFAAALAAEVEAHGYEPEEYEEDEGADAYVSPNVASVSS